ncbi:flagellar hook-length control protein FliK [Aureimonas jatrophae]|uniref:Hook-length control protein FliK n=1 Tax=Aureimonas jatrophae TaxID=1166073 RepID=A0A1H0JF95_9HYPH|nr:flagellar hook-length control protein FliK [Aureimonas jatrophae]MBB3951433.1 hypothetical protein [Aureimonas jatrophae]SDO42465.1 hook-length control protein FliK [Aureimonas jatrophae]
MKIDASPFLALEKDAAPRGARSGGDDAGAGQAFGAAVAKAGEKGTAPKRETLDQERNAPTRSTADDGVADTDNRKDTVADAAITGQTPAADLMALVSALVAPDATAEPEGEQKDGETDPALGRAAQLHEGEELGDDVAASRLPRVQVLRTETHFEPRLEGAVIEAAEVASASASASEADLSDALVQVLKTQDGAVAGKAPDTLHPHLGSQAAGERASERETAPSRGPTVPVRFDEAVARLGQGGSDTGGGAGSNARQDGHGTGRRAASDRAEPASAVSRLDTRADIVAARTADDGSSGGGSIPGLALQVAARIADALGSVPAANGSAPGDTASQPAENAHLRMRAGGAALKTLTIQLQPEHLGTLEVSMRLREGKLAIELAASKPEAAAALTQDRDTLRKVLESAGFSLDDAALTVTVRDAPTLRANDTGSSNSGSGSDRGASSFAGGQSSQRDEPQQQESRLRHAERPGGETAPTAASTGASATARAAGQTYL